MRILVTGGAGFIGKHLCRRLMSEGHEVWSLDLPGKTHAAGTSAIEFDLAWERLGVRLPEFVTADAIYHLACHASPARYRRDAAHTLQTCSHGTKEVLEYAFGNDCEPRVLLASTSEIYGEPEVHPQPESYRGNVSCFGPRSMYDEGKRYAESLCWAYYEQWEVDTRIARIFNTYGPGMDFGDGRVISNFVTQALKGEPLTIYGDGSQTRSFCYIDDMVEGLIRLMEYEGEECHEPCNLGNPEETDIKSIAMNTVSAVNAGKMLFADSYLTAYSPLPQDDPTRRCPDITRAKRNLGWEPKVSLSEGLRRTVEDFRERMK